MGEVKIEKWVYGGAGLGRAEGEVTLVPFVMPGEVVQLEVMRRRAGVAEGRAAGIIEPSAERVEALCAVFGRCGGCHYQMAPYEYQVARKVEILREVIRRVGRMEAPAEIQVAAGEPWGYRNRSQFHFGKHTLGYKMAASGKVVDVEECPISAPGVNAALKALRARRRDRHFPRFLKEVELFTNGERTMVNVLETEGGRGVAKGFFEWLEESIPGAAAGALEYAAAGETYRVSHKSFFQVNRFLMERMVECALEGAEGEQGLDLYAGVGLFTVPMARRMGKAAGVESDPAAARDLEHNIAQAGVAAAARRMQAEQYLENCTQIADFVLADPPRAGLGKAVVKHLARLQPRRVTLVSCDAATMARDVAALCAAGYKVAGMSLLDLFPQTYHLESVVRLER